MQLSNVEIQKFSDTLGETISPLNIAKAEKTRVSLALEEALLRYKDILGEDSEFTYRIKRFFMVLLVEVSVKGNSFDALHPEGDVSTNILDGFFVNGKSQVLYRYRNGKNIISFSIPLDAKKIKLPGSTSLYAIILGIILGLLMRNLPKSFIFQLTDDYIAPVYSTLMDLLKGLMGPVIFVSLVLGICVFDDLKALSTVGKNTMLTFLKVITSIYILAVAACLFVFPSKGRVAVAFNPAEIVSLLLSSVPTNAFAPFHEGNMVQIVMLGFMCGIAILILGEKASSIKQLLLEVKFLLFTILGFFTKLLPVIVFLSVLKVVLTTDLSDTADVWKIIAADQILVVILAIVSLASISIKAKVKLSVLAQKINPLFYTSFTTGSSTPTIPKYYKTLPEDFGIYEKFSNYWIPLSCSFFSPSIITALIIYAFYSAQAQHVGISVSWLLVLYIMILQLGMASPKIPGGIVVPCTIILSELGLTTDQLGIIMAANVIILYLDTGVSAVINCCCSIYDAMKQNSIDLNKLRS